MRKPPKYIVTAKRLREMLAEIPDDTLVFVRCVGGKDFFAVEPLLAYSGAEMGRVKWFVNYHWYKVADPEDKEIAAFII